MSWSDIVVPAVTGIASVATTGGAFVAFLNRKTKRDRQLEQEEKDTQIDQLKIDVTKDVVVLLRDELARKEKQGLEKDEHIEYQDRVISWLRRRVVRLEDWTELVRRENPSLQISAVPTDPNDPPPVAPRRRESENG